MSGTANSSVRDDIVIQVQAGMLVHAGQGVVDAICWYQMIVTDPIHCCSDHAGLARCPDCAGLLNAFHPSKTARFSDQRGIVADQCPRFARAAGFSQSEGFAHTSTDAIDATPGEVVV